MSRRRKRQQALTQDQIDEIVISQAEDQPAWEEAGEVRRPSSDERTSASGHLKLVETWADNDFPSHEEIRAGIGEDLPREPF